MCMRGYRRVGRDLENCRQTGGLVDRAFSIDFYGHIGTADQMHARRHADIDRQFEGQRLRGWLASNFVSYTHDSSLWIPTGPLEGRRVVRGREGDCRAHYLAAGGFDADHGGAGPGTASLAGPRAG